MKVVTASEMQEIDRISIQELGIPGEVLMGCAGKAVADHLQEAWPLVKRIAVFAGTGNNGGDGFVAAYHCAQHGIEATVYLVGDENRISATSRIYYSLCVKAGIPVTAVSDPGALDLEGYDCIIDAILGTGSSGEVRGIAADVIRAVNDSDAPVLSVDIPSGLGSDGAAPEGEAVIADRTVTIGLPKRSLVTYPGKEYAGILHVADIGFPAYLTSSDRLKNELIDDDFFRTNAIRAIEAEYCSNPDAHKGARGHLLIVGGFETMEGAAMLSASAALETGVGLVTLLTTAAGRQAIAGAIPELITMALPASGEDTPAALRTLLATRKYNAVVIGPGMGRTDFSYRVAESVFGSLASLGIKRAVVDGDGLFHLAEYIKKNRLDPAVEWIITPHFLEASRFLGISVEAIKDDRPGAAALLSQKMSCTAVLKGPATIVSSNGSQFINTTGSAALATAGSGDVLTGIIGALLLRRYTAAHAAACGVWIHGRAADRFCDARACDVLKSSDILSCIRSAKSSM